MCICVRSCSPSGCLLQGQPKYKIISLWKYLRNSSDFVGFSSHPAQNMLHISAFNVFTLGTSVRRVPERNIKILLLYCVWSASIICYFESMIMLIYREKCVQMNRKIKMYESWKVLEWVEIGSNDFFFGFECLPDEIFKCLKQKMKSTNTMKREGVRFELIHERLIFRDIQIKKFANSD